MTGHELLAWLQSQSDDVLARRVVRDDADYGESDVDPRIDAPVTKLAKDHKPFTVPKWDVEEEVIRL